MLNYVLEKLPVTKPEVEWQLQGVRGVLVTFLGQEGWGRLHTGIHNLVAFKGQLALSNQGNFELTRAQSQRFL